MIRRALFAAVALGLPLLWLFAPYGRTVDMMGTGEARTFARAALRLVNEALASTRAIEVGDAVMAVGLLGLFAPLYPAAIAALMLAVPRRMAARRRWAWMLEGTIVLLLSPAGCVLAILDVSILMPGAPPPVLQWPLWLLSGGAMAGGLAAIWLGIARRSRLARIALS